MLRLSVRRVFVFAVVLIICLWIPLPAAAAPPAQAPPVPNDSFGAAQPLAVGAPVQETLQPRGDADWYVLQIDAPGELQIAVSGSPPELDIDVRVWNANRDTISDWFAPLNQGGDVHGLVDIAEAGRYYLEVRDGGDNAESAQPYTLAASFTPAQDQGEPNNTFGAAAPLAFDVPISATILPRGEADWYMIEVDHHGELQLALSNTPPELDIVFRVWDADRNTITDWFAPLAKGGAVQAVVDLPAPRHYYIEVRDGGDDGRSIQPYALVAHFTPSADLLEPNNTFGAAVELKLGSAISATILPAREADWFVFTAPHHGELNLLVSNVPSELAVFVRVWNANRDTLSDWFRPLSPGGETQARFDIPAPGRYYLEVMGDGDERSIQPFNLRVDFSPAADLLEPDNDFGHAAALGVDRSVQANILPAGDVDWYYFDAPQAGEVHFGVTGVDPEMAVSLRVWNANRDTISGWFSPLNAGGDTNGKIDLTAPGRYYLEVAAEGGQRSLQPYLLQLSFQPSDDAHEPNDSQAAAAGVALDQTIVGTIWPAGDADWYTFVAPQTGDLHLLATQIAPELSLTLRMWDANGGPVSDWLSSPAPGENVTGAISVTEAITYMLEARATDGGAAAVQPYLLYLSMEPIDPSKVLPTGATGVATATTTAAPVTTKTETTEITPTGKVTILTSGQIGPLGGDLFVTGDQAGVDGARLAVPPAALAELTTIDIGITPDAPAGAPFGLQPAGRYWVLAPAGLAFAQPATITLPVPPGAAAETMFIGHWTGNEWVDLDGQQANGLISAPVTGFSTFGVFCGRLEEYAAVRIENATSSPYVNLRYVSGPSPTPETAATFAAGCPPPADLATAWELQQGETAFLLLRPGMYEFNVAYPQPQPGVANSMFIAFLPGADQTIQLHDDGASSSDPQTAIEFPGRQVVAGSNTRPLLGCNAEVPAGANVTNNDPGATALPSRRVRIDNLKLEQLPPKGAGVRLTGLANDPEGSQLRPFWTMTGGVIKYTTAGDPVASGAPIADQFTFQPTVAGDYTVYLTVYDDKGLFDECRWDISVQANSKPEIKVLSGRTVVEFGRLDDERSQGVGQIIPLPTAMRPGVAAPLVVASLITPTASVIWDGLTLCPTAVAGPFALLPQDANTVIGAPAPVDLMAPKAFPDDTNRWVNPGRTCVWALVADGDGDALATEWEFPGPIFGSGTFFAAVAVPAGYHADAPAGLALGAFIRTYEQLAAYNSWVSALANLGGVPPAIVWEAWDDPCVGQDTNACPTAIAGGGVETIVAQTGDGYSLPPRTGYTAIAVTPEGTAEGGECGAVFFISSLTPEPADPAADQDVTVTARVAPLVEGCLLDMSIQGTDGYSNQAWIPTNKSGEAAFFIPGGAEDVEDVVVARFCSPLSDLATPPPAAQTCVTPLGNPGQWVEMEVTYRF